MKPTDLDQNHYPITRVREALAKDSRVNELNVEIKVEGRKVFVSGCVASPSGAMRSPSSHRNCFPTARSATRPKWSECRKARRRRSCPDRSAGRSTHSVPVPWELSPRGGRRGADLILHAHAHRGTEKGITLGGIPVRNVAQPLIKHACNLYSFDGKRLSVAAAAS